MQTTKYQTLDPRQLSRGARNTSDRYAGNPEPANAVQARAQAYGSQLRNAAGGLVQLDPARLAIGANNRGLYEGIANVYDAARAPDVTMKGLPTEDLGRIPFERDGPLQVNEAYVRRVAKNPAAVLGSIGQVNEALRKGHAYLSGLVGNRSPFQFKIAVSTSSQLGTGDIELAGTQHLPLSEGAAMANIDEGRAFTVTMDSLGNRQTAVGSKNSIDVFKKLAAGSHQEKAMALMVASALGAAQVLGVTLDNISKKKGDVARLMKLVHDVAQRSLANVAQGRLKAAQYLAAAPGRTAGFGNQLGAYIDVRDNDFAWRQQQAGIFAANARSGPQRFGQALHPALQDGCMQYHSDTGASVAGGKANFLQAYNNRVTRRRSRLSAAGNPGGMNQYDACVTGAGQTAGPGNQSYGAYGEDFWAQRPAARDAAAGLSQARIAASQANPEDWAHSYSEITGRRGLFQNKQRQRAGLGLGPARGAAGVGGRRLNPNAAAFEPQQQQLQQQEEELPPMLGGRRRGRRLGPW